MSLNYLCAGYKTFFNHIDPAMRMMSALLHQNRSPDELPGIIAAQEASRFAEVGRNDPCPCRSTIKFKSCHGVAMKCWLA